MALYAIFSIHLHVVDFCIKRCLWGKANRWLPRRQNPRSMWGIVFGTLKTKFASFHHFSESPHGVCRGNFSHRQSQFTSASAYQVKIKAAISIRIDHQPIFVYLREYQLLAQLITTWKNSRYLESTASADTNILNKSLSRASTLQPVFTGCHS